MGNVVLSLRAGGSDTITRGLNEVRRKINGGALRNAYIHTYIHTYNALLKESKVGSSAMCDGTNWTNFLYTYMHR